jgi:uncharacterized damage-inducible protein DinB
MTPAPANEQLQVRYIADLLHRTVDGPMWHGPSLSEALDGVDVGHAARRPIESAHSIWELVRHVTAWAQIARARLGEGVVPDPTTDEDWPPVTETDADAWQRDLAAMREAYDTLARAVRELPDARLRDTVPGRDHSIRTLLHGVVEHGTYHGGQIVLLKKL